MLITDEHRKELEQHFFVIKRAIRWVLLIFPNKKLQFQSVLSKSSKKAIQGSFPEELNLRMIETLRGLYPGLPLGYSGHEQGIAPTLAAVAMGVSFVERHITLDRRMWGSDQTASLEKDDLMRLVSGIREIEKALGDGRKRITSGEQFARKKLRRR